MGKRIDKAQVLAIVLLYQLVFVGHASAGIFEWISPEEIKNSTDAPLLASIGEGSISFEKSFSWGMRLPEVEEVKPEIKILKTYTVRATGYSSTPDQTDDTPFITASGRYVRDGIIAANFFMDGKRVPFGTKVRIPEVYGDKIFIVEDRMNARYTNNIDIWFPERSLAKTFGSKKVTIEIIEES